MIFHRSILALIGSTLAVLAMVHWFAPVSGAARAPRADKTGPDPFQASSMAWPRVVQDFDQVQVRLAAPTKRVVSQYWSIDEFLYTVLSPQSIVGVSESAYLPRISNVYEQAQQQKPVIATDPERVLRQNPDLIVASSSARADFTALVRSTDVPIYRLATMFTTLDQIADTIGLTGYLTGQDARAERKRQRFLQAVEAARKAKPAGVRSPRILGFGGRYSYGSQTLFHDIATTLGAINVGAEGGLVGYDSVSTEQILRWDPEWIIVGAEEGKQDQLRARLLEDPAIGLTQAARNGRILVYDQRVFLPMSPFTTRILQVLAKDLYAQ